MRVAVVGMGKMGLLHSSILNAIPDVEVVALCDKSFLLRRFLGKVFKGVKVFKDVNELSKADVDAVYVTTPIPSHYGVAKALYSEGIASNVFVEKTLALNFEQARELRDLAQDYGGVNMVGYVRRFAVTFREAKRLLDEGVIGEPVSFSAYAYSSEFYGVDKAAKVRVPRVGVVRDLGCYAIDLALWFFGELEVLDAEVKAVVSERSEDSARVEVEASGGLRGEFSFSWCVDKHRMPEAGFVVEGSEGALSVNDDKLELRLKDGGVSRWFRHDLKDTVDFWLGLPEFFREDKHFVDCVVRGCSAEPSFVDGAEVDRIIDEIRSRAGRYG